MLLRKHIGNGKICDIEQMGLERVLRLSIEHRDEMGDLSIKFLYVEIMGKHSNIIFTDSDNKIMIVSSIFHQLLVLSERYCLKTIFYSYARGKDRSFSIDENDFAMINAKNQTLKGLLSCSFIGFRQSHQWKYALEPG